MNIWPVSASGTLVNRAILATLQSEYSACANFVCEELTAALGSDLASIYLRGSVAIGGAVAPYSDLDFLVLTHSEPVCELDIIRARTLVRFPFVEDVDIGVCRTADLGVTAFGKVAQSYLLVEARRLAGDDAIAGVPSARPDAAFAKSRFPEFGLESAGLLAILEGREPLKSYRGVPRSANFWARWAMRAVIRTTHLVAMLDTGLYSNNLATCCRLATEHFIAHGDWIERAFANERRAASDPADAAAILRWWRTTILPLWNARIDPGIG